MNIQQLMIASVLMVGIVRGTSIGSPNTCCEVMIPGHGVDAQDGKSVFTTIPNTDKIPASGKVTLNITTTDPAIKFKGYLVVATMAGMDHIVGFFGKPDDGKILTCQLASNATILNSAVTHNDNLPKSSVLVDWFPNGFEGEVVFKTTYVLNATTYWVKEESAVVRVGEVPVTEAPPPTTDGAMDFAAQPSVLMTTLVFLLCAVLIR